MGASYDSVDHNPDSSVRIDGTLISSLTSDNGGINSPIFFIHSISPSHVRSYGECIAKHCKEEQALFASVFFRRVLSVFPAEGKRRLVPTLAYQLAVSPYAPEELKVEILGALYMEPDIPEHNLKNQFQKLIVNPLLNVAHMLPADHPVIFLLDSVQNIDSAVVVDVLRELTSAVNFLRQATVPVNAKAVITGVGYDKIFQAFKSDPPDQITSMPVSGPPSLLARSRAVFFPVLDWKYGRPEFFQRLVELSGVGVAMVGLPAFVMLTSMAILPAPLGVLVGTFGSLFLAIGMATAASVGLTIVVYREAIRFVYNKSV